MPKPKKGDVLRWQGSVYKIVSDPQVPEFLDYFGSTWKLEAQAEHHLDGYPSKSTRVRVEKVVFDKFEDVEKSGWEYAEDPFVRFVRATRQQAGLED